ncbi:hypothetical protein GQ53DRAFT_710631 [Thozetella sp. PMI_491]|nr:hypothetical protein GQ53DRAFT_710631 [Thozetella sp. PMI_491]
MGSISRPDILVAIDLGTTYTGTIATNSLQTPIHILQNWPGCSTRNEQKVPTCLVYNQDKDRTLSSWGFLCEEDDGPGKQRFEFFKIFLDSKTLQGAHRQGIPSVPATSADAQQLVRDYLEQIYFHVKDTVEKHTGAIGSMGGWGNLAVEFIFSVPTTWRSLESINLFKSTIASAGFGTESPRHSATIELTESEAAAVATIKRRNIAFEKNDMFLSIDAGGGTTDLALMCVTEPGEPFPSLAQMATVDGVGIGSTLIDRAFLALVHQRLSLFPDLKWQLPPDSAERLARSERFKSMKHKFGERVYDSPIYKLPMEGVGYTFNYPDAGIEGGRILFSRAQIQSLFDPQVQAMLAKIREQLDWFHHNHPSSYIRYTILSGGLGSSAYVSEEIQNQLNADPHPAAPLITVVQDPEPQLVVVKGLLLDRMQKIDSGVRSVLAQRRARASYGVVCKQRYNAAIHGNEETMTDSIDGLLYAMNQIEWIIKKGDVVDPERPTVSDYKKKVEMNSTVRQWDNFIMISHNDRESLPKNSKDPDAKKLCTVQSDLSGVTTNELELRKQSRSCFRKGKKWYVCSFEVRAIVAPADLRFELWFAGQKFSRNHEPIKVTWDEAGTKLEPPRPPSPQLYPRIVGEIESW